MKNIVAFVLWILVLEELLLVAYARKKANGKPQTGKSNKHGRGNTAMTMTNEKVTPILLTEEHSKGVTPMKMKKGKSKGMTPIKMKKGKSKGVTPIKITTKRPMKMTTETSKEVTPIMVTNEISKEVTMTKEASREITSVKMTNDTTTQATLITNDTDGSSCPGQFHCSGGLCLSLSLVCDGKADCPDDSDEDGCHIIGVHLPWWAIKILCLLAIAVVLLIIIIIVLVVKRLMVSKDYERV